MNLNILFSLALMSNNFLFKKHFVLNMSYTLIKVIFDIGRTMSVRATIKSIFVLSLFCLATYLMIWPTSTYSDSEVDLCSYDEWANNRFVYNPRTLRWTAINSDGRVVKSGRGSSGRAYCPDTGRHCRTPSGVYHVLYKQGASCKSSRYPVGRGGSPMPYCMYFSKNYAVHGSYEVPHYNASHGCIRVPPADAKWLYYHFMDIGTTVEVKPY